EAYGAGSGCFHRCLLAIADPQAVEPVAVVDYLFNRLDIDDCIAGCAQKRRVAQPGQQLAQRIVGWIFISGSMYPRSTMAPDRSDDLPFVQQFDDVLLEVLNRKPSLL